ncbi:MAG: arginine decarboxylase [Bernardetiaceae bacterium]|jgi:arginine decarboxylase|nr:arginine decarboxylase [Bernardetiaceae bacterium]
MQYADLIQQTFHFPTPIFKVENNELMFNNVPLMPIIERYGTPLRLMYLPKIGEKIEQARQMFTSAMQKVNYQGTYTYCYCTKSSHYRFVLEQTLKHQAQLETSSAYDINIVKSLYHDGLIDKDILIVCNGFKRKLYTDQIVELLNLGFANVVPILDNKEEIDAYAHVPGPVRLGIRVATDEKPDFSFYTSRLGIRYHDVLDFYKERLQGNPQFSLKMLHFFINSGIKDTAYYWSELNRFVYKYCELKKICPELDTIDIGGGMPIQTSLHWDFNYQQMIDEIVKVVKYVCDKNFVPTPHLITEFGSFTVGESGAHIFSVLGQKLQNERERWYMIDGSFITHLPDTWGLGSRFIMLPVNNWHHEYQQVNLGGMTCDSDDYYNTEAYTINIYLPQLENGSEDNQRQYIGFFHTGAYQDTIGGVGGLQHCLIPCARQVLIDHDANGELRTRLFADEQSSTDMLKLLGYNVNPPANW